MIQENESGVTDERIDSVVGRSLARPAESSPQNPAQNPGQDTDHGPAEDGDAREAIAVMETPLVTETSAADTGDGTAGVTPSISASISETTPETVLDQGSGAAHAEALEAAVPETAKDTATGSPSHSPADMATENGVRVTIAAPTEEIGIASGTQYRQDVRYEVEGDAEVFVKTGSMGTTLLRGHILDLSSTGCFIQTMARVMIKPGTVVQLIFSVYGTTFRIDATSRYARMRVGVGFRFLEMDEPTHKRLDAVLGDIRSRLISENAAAQLPVIDRAILE